MADRLMPHARPVGEFFRQDLLSVAGAAVGLVVVAAVWLALMVRPEWDARALADAPVIEARVLDARVGSLARYPRPAITYVLPDGTEVWESFNFAPGISGADVERLRPGDPITVHFDPARGAVSELRVRSARLWSWVLLVVPVLVLVAVLLALRELATLVRLRRWRSTAAVGVSRGEGRRLRVEARSLSSSAPAPQGSIVSPPPVPYSARYAARLVFGGVERTVRSVPERHVVVEGPDWSFDLDVTEGEPFLSVLDTGLAALDPQHLIVMASYEHARAAGALGYRYACLSPAGALLWTLVSPQEAFGDVVLLPGRLVRLSVGGSPDASLEAQVVDLDTGRVVGRHPVTTPEHMLHASREIGARPQGRFDVREGRIFIHVGSFPHTRALPSYLARGRADRGIITIPDEGRFDVEVLVGDGDRVALRGATPDGIG